MEYLESDNDIDDCSLLEEYFNNYPIHSNYFEFKEFLHIIVKISKNHYWDDLIDKRIKLLLSYFAKNINNIFSNFEIISIFKNCKRILLFLLQKQIAKIDRSTIDIFINMAKKDRYYCHFFYPEIKSLNLFEIDLTEIENDISNIEDFEKKREIGENASYICQLIRHDLVEELIAYINRNNISLSSKINQSIFETNRLLIKNKKIKLIEYAAFFGSILIFRFLMNNNVELEPSLWIYSIHSKNAELFHLIEECDIESNDKVLFNSYAESIKCHHNDFANYIQDNLLNEPLREKLEIDKCMHYNNFRNTMNPSNLKHFFLCAASYDYYNIVKILIESKKVDVNVKVFNHVFVVYSFKIFSYTNILT